MPPYAVSDRDMMINHISPLNGKIKLVFKMNVYCAHDILINSFNTCSIKLKTKNELKKTTIHGGGGL